MTNSIWGPLRLVLSPSNNRPIEIGWSAELKDGSRSAIAGADLRRRIIQLHPSLKRDPRERARILAHEIFHFVWVRLGNPKRAAWKQHLREELQRGARGELGWSSEWRKRELPARFDAYACEAFCDTAAWLYSGVEKHEEFTLARRWRKARRRFFQDELDLPFRY